jgi:putative copper export protein
MLGFAAAVVSETLTHQSVWSQIAGKYVNTQMVEAPDGNSALAYFAVVVLVTMASLMPKLIDDLNVDSKSFGPFTPGLESLLGRIAMLGFSGLILVEAVKQSPLL